MQINAYHVDVIDLSNLPVKCVFHYFVLCVISVYQNK